MSDERRADAPQQEEEGTNPVRGAEEVRQNQPGSKGDGSAFRAGQGNQDAEEADGEPIVRSRAQKPNPNQTATEATMEPGGDLGHKRTTL
jgi:hypothetical protein